MNSPVIVSAPLKSNTTGDAASPFVVPLQLAQPPLRSSESCLMYSPFSTTSISNIPQGQSCGTDNVAVTELLPVGISSTCVAATLSNRVYACLGRNRSVSTRSAVTGPETDFNSSRIGR